MEDRQRKLSRNIGKDTHVRSLESNMFQSQSTGTLKVITGEVFIPQPEPIFSQTAVSVNLTKGGTLTGVAYPGAFIEPITGNLHGVYEGPIPGQMVNVGFIEGNSAAPFVLNRYPYQGSGDTATEIDYITPLLTAGYNPMDVAIGHISGSYLSFNTGFPYPGSLPGSVDLQAMTDLNLQSKVGITLSCFATLKLDTLANIELSGTVIQLNGNTDFAITYIPMQAAWASLITQLNTNLGLISATLASLTGAASFSVPYVVVPVVSDMSGAKNISVLM